MAQNLKILTWNIQNYGNTKASFSDVMTAIAKVVMASRPDIFVLLELNTTDNTTAKKLAKHMAKALYTMSNKVYGGSDYRVCVISPNTGLEFYAFFIKDETKTIPLLAKRRTNDADVTEIGSGGLTYSDVKFASSVIAPGVKVLKNFPLLSPDVASYNYYGRDLGVPDWTAVRLPVLGTFWCTGATGNNRLLPIIACHFAADHVQASQQVKKLNNFSIMRGLGPAPVSPNIPAQSPIVMRVVNGATVDTTLQGYVLTGDFNLNYLSSREIDYYDPITDNTYPGLNDNLYIKTGTHLVTYSNFSPRDYKNTEELAINGYDNLMLGVNPASLNKASGKSPHVMDIPDWIQRRVLKLNQCVDHYAELDKRGFTSASYDYLATDFGKQLRGDKSHLINIAGSLVGGRLISDHLPVEFILTLQ